MCPHAPHYGIFHDRCSTWFFAFQKTTFDLSCSAISIVEKARKQNKMQNCGSLQSLASYSFAKRLAKVSLQKEPEELETL